MHRCVLVYNARGVPQEAAVRAGRDVARRVASELSRRLALAHERGTRVLGLSATPAAALRSRVTAAHLCHAAAAAAIRKHAMNAPIPKPAFEARPAPGPRRAARRPGGNRRAHAAHAGSSSDPGRSIAGGCSASRCSSRTGPADSIAMLERCWRGARLRRRACRSGARLSCARAGRARGARAKYAGCSRQSPTTTAPGWPTGTRWSTSDQYDDARVAFERARLTDPQRAAHRAGHRAALLADDRRKAGGLFRDILQADASHAAALCGLAALSLAADKPERRRAPAAPRRCAVARTCPRLARAGAGAAGPGQARGGRGRRAHLAQDRAGQPGDLDHDRRGVGTRCCARRRRSRPTSTRRGCNPDEVRLRLSIGHVQKTLGQRTTARPPTRRRSRCDPGMRRGVLESCRPEELRLQRRGAGGHAGCIGSDARRAQERGPAAFRTRQGPRAAPRYPEAFSHYAQGNALRRRGCAV